MPNGHNSTDSKDSAPSSIFRRIKNPEALAAELREGDGIDPRLERRRKQNAFNKSKPNHAALRLGGQIARSIRNNLGGRVLADFDVFSVEPCKGNLYLVTLKAIDPDFLFDETAVLEEANSERGRLRSELAISITRKKVPDLLFRVLPNTALDHKKA